ncbi:acyl-homoserine-lactone synthase [Jannaschia sp. LMIT008]|uniref:acyl-homoserine-lactone synthase n=1 Tax=Jannaschia maritima TaxID=3032585 RepID=UPI0028119C8E|nr:acyl-homoserine-lactone synthase [Jannaschia sp. LMIT008]
MIRYIYASQLDAHAELAAEMFRDRAAQFRDRMGWDVTVDDLGWETDQYDAIDPLYVIAEDEDGHHAGSVRFLPTTGRTMLGEIFPHLMGGAPIRSPLIWECTRFCLSPKAAYGKDGAGVAQKLLLGGLQLGLEMGCTHSLGVFDRPMVRVYRRLGWSPEVLGSQDGISAGIWELSEGVADHFCGALGIDRAEAKGWLDASLSTLTPAATPVALPVRA